MKNPFKLSNTTFSSLPNQSAGILDDFAVRKDVATIEGTIEKIPVNANDITNKAYVDSQISGENHWDLAGTELQPHILGTGVAISGALLLKDTDTANQIRLEYTDAGYVHSNGVLYLWGDSGIYFNGNITSNINLYYRKC